MMRASVHRLTMMDWRDVFTQHLRWSEKTGRTSGSPQWDPDGLNVIGVRMNPVTSFYVRGKQDWNDFLVLVDTREIAVRENRTVTVLRATVDPADVRENPKGIAHLAEGCWDAYVRGRHKAPWRMALVQRTAPVLVIRTTPQGKVTVHERGYFGINIHNAMGLGKPSAGCTVIMPEKIGMRDRNWLRFRDILAEAPDRPSRTYCLVSHEHMQQYGYPLTEALPAG
jgi:hypothetical protein